MQYVQFNKKTSLLILQGGIEYNTIHDKEEYDICTCLI